jgi:hypothetical protein
MAEHKFTIPAQMDHGITVFEYGVRVDKDCEKAVWQQIQLSRKLYNDIIAAMRRTHEEMSQFVLDRAGADAKKLAEKINVLIEKFKAAKADQNEEGMKEAVLALRENRAALFAQLKEVRLNNKDEINRNYFSRIGLKSTCETYQLRSQAVKDGLGWATANDVLDRALMAFKKRIMTGQPPKFSIGSERLKDALQIQFTQAGGCPVETLFGNGHSGLMLKATNGFGRRKHGEFSFRLGAAGADAWATGTCIFHRPIPDGSTIATAALVRKRIGNGYKYTMQLVAKTPKDEAAQHPLQPRKFCTLHFGWALTTAGRHVMAIADQADPEAARLISLPESIETDFKRVEEIASKRSDLLTGVAAWFKSPKAVIKGVDETIADELDALKRLPVLYFAAARLHRLCNRLLEADIALPATLKQWRAEDRRLLQDSAWLGRRARLRRLDFYRVIASQLVRSYQTIVIETIDLKKANTKIDMTTGEKGEMNRKSRYGQRVAAIYEMQTALRQAAGKEGCVILELHGEKTTSSCGFCAVDGVVADSENHQLLHCPHCGAVVNRKQNGAAIAWQLAEPLIDDLTAEAKAHAVLQADERKAAAASKKEKVVAARAANRKLREPQAIEVSG